MNYTEIKDKLHGIAFPNYVPILPWGSTEPHGEHLPYLTDSILAEAVAKGVVKSANEKLAALRENMPLPWCNVVESEGYVFTVLPVVSLGSQNVSQVDSYPFCIHYNAETQKAVLDDTITSLKRQGVHCLYIINGHNGNSLKAIIRDLMVKHNGNGKEHGDDYFSIYLCNYLDVLETREGREYLSENGVMQYPLDEHAGYTETSLMMYVAPEEVHREYLPSEDVGGLPRTGGSWWTPSDWKKRSVNSRVGFVEGASAMAGKVMFNYVVDKLSEELLTK